RVEVIRILAGQIVRFAAMVASPFSLAADSWLRIHKLLVVKGYNYKLAALSDAADYFIATVDGNNSEPVINQADILDPALMRSGQLNCKIESLYPTEEARACILQDIFTEVIYDRRETSIRINFKGARRKALKHIEAFVRTFSDRQAFSAAALSSAPAVLTQVSESTCIHEVGPSPSAGMTLFFCFKGDPRKDRIRRRVSRTNEMNINPVGDPGEN
nr:hypothetical protein [Tanacetum cinerariifolium]